MRRDVLLALVVFCPLVLAAVDLPSDAAPPRAARKPVSDTYFGEAVQDDYRWLEDWNDPDTRAWSEAQNAFTRSVLDRLPAVEAIRERVRQIATFPSPSYGSLVRRGETLFAIKNEPPKQQPFLVVVKSPDEPGSERILVDPNLLDPKGGTAIDFFVPSLDGRRVAVSLSRGGSEAGDIHVYEAASGRKLSDVVPRVNGGTAGGDVAWNADASGFFYTRYPRGEEREPKDREFYQQVHFHRVGTATEADVYAVGRDFPRIAETTLESSPDGSVVLASVKNGDGGEVSQYLRGFDGNWKKLASDADRAIEGKFGSDGSLYILSRKVAPRGRILRLPPGATSLADAKVVVPASEAVIDDFCLSGDRLFVADLMGGPSQIRVFDRDGGAKGTVAVLPASSVTGMVPAGSGGILFENQSVVVPPAWFGAGPDGRVTPTAWKRPSPVDFSDAEVAREWAVSKDGTRVPIDILRLKGTKRDGNAPSILYGYGGYGISQRPVFSAMKRAWLEQGGVFAVALLRGGGEYGDDWHLQGNLTRKQNVFDDFAACAKRLVAAGYTRRARLAIEGGSNGGLLMGAALTQHPELFGAVVAHVGIYDMLRVELSPNGAFNVTEFGTVRHPAQFRALHAYSPYHRVVNGTPYPPVLFLTGDNDPRVDPMQSRKMTARLQAATSSKQPILLRTSSGSGHGIGSSLDEQAGKAADVYAFLFDRLGVAYRPVSANP